jgi:hypothetical protein
MSDTYRWTLEEYAARCEIDDSIREVLTEGALDRQVFDDAVVRWGAEDANVLDSDFIHVDPTVLREIGAAGSVRAKLVVVAQELERIARDSNGVRARIAVVVDRDYEMNPVASRFLFLTDGHSIENYLIDERILDRFVRVGLGEARSGRGRDGRTRSNQTRLPGRELLTRVLAPAMLLASLRLSLREGDSLGVFGGWERYVTTPPDGRMVLDVSRLLKQILERAGRGDEARAIEVRAEQLLAGAVVGPKYLVRGHDFVDLLSKLLKSRWGAALGGSAVRRLSTDELSRLLFMCVPTYVLDGFPLFSAVRALLTR